MLKLICRVVILPAAAGAYVALKLTREGVCRSASAEASPEASAEGQPQNPSEGPAGSAEERLPDTTPRPPAAHLCRTVALHQPLSLCSDCGSATSRTLEGLFPLHTPHPDAALTLLTASLLSPPHALALDPHAGEPCPSSRARPDA